MGKRRRMPKTPEGFLALPPLLRRALWPDLPPLLAQRTLSLHYERQAQTEAWLAGLEGSQARVEAGANLEEVRAFMAGHPELAPRKREPVRCKWEVPATAGEPPGPRDPLENVEAIAESIKRAISRMEDPDS